MLYCARRRRAKTDERVDGRDTEEPVVARHCVQAIRRNHGVVRAAVRGAHGRIEARRILQRRMQVEVLVVAGWDITCWLQRGLEVDARPCVYVHQTVVALDAERTKRADAIRQLDAVDSHHLAHDLEHVVRICFHRDSNLSAGTQEPARGGAVECLRAEGWQVSKWEDAHAHDVILVAAERGDVRVAVALAVHLKRRANLSGAGPFLSTPTARLKAGAGALLTTPAATFEAGARPLLATPTRGLGSRAGASFAATTASLKATPRPRWPARRARCSLAVILRARC